MTKNVFSGVEPGKPFTAAQIKANRGGADVMAWYFGLVPLDQMRWPRPDIKGDRNVLR